MKGKAPSLWVVASTLIAFGTAHTLYRAAAGELPRSAWHLGAEYFNIAQSLARGHGFSDPFAETTGPTAWMPPLLPALYALLLVTLGSKWGVTIAAIICARAGYILSGVLIYSSARRLNSLGSPWIAVAILVAWELVFHYWYVELTSDIWLTTLVMSLLMWLFVAEDCKQTLKFPVYWGLLGGAITLAAPAILAPWLAALIWLTATTGFKLKRHGLVIALALVMMLPWTTRNFLIFDKFIPTKSNLGYELYQTNVLDKDGVHDLVSMQRHPFNNFKSRFEYASEGEIQFVASRGQLFKEAFRQSPAEFWRRVHFRAQSALVLYHPLIPQQDPWLLPFKRALHALAPLLLIAALLFGHARQASARLALLWLVYLTPYIVVAFYARYSLPLVPIYALSSFLGIDALRLLWLRVPASASSVSSPTTSAEEQAT